MGRLLVFSFLIFLFGASIYFISTLGWLYGKFFGTVSPVFFLFEFANAVLLISIAGALAGFAYSSLSPKRRSVMVNVVEKPKVSVGMTAYNDELSIGKAVSEFTALKEVSEIIVVDNNCTDATAEVAKKAGARVVPEKVQGYGASCIRALKECSKSGNLVCLVEGDMTYFASDLKKLLAYIENVDMVVGTRTTLEIVSSDSQVTPFIKLGNVFIAKLIQMRYWGQLRLTDVGCTYRLIRPQARAKIIGKLKVTGNHFSPHMIMVALEEGLKVIECPIAFRKRIGQSKGVGQDVVKGLINGFQMIGILLRS